MAVQRVRGQSIRDEACPFDGTSHLGQRSGQADGLLRPYPTGGARLSEPMGAYSGSGMPPISPDS
ncbi:uncharacterized protein STAUR_7471 [Stigmatella aurantiaca DW4/3-1]|uniref:Uncharacterized protein n=1 Tax=Stigmatella aurantiaca (strain DW4/3-1) TaxID=378806 RepID=E3FFW8_STIAD|nr:uncharacterized protein STAUR_7471 [Stigmatella aurantiaca DW4/3-1]